MYIHCRTVHGHFIVLEAIKELPHNSDVGPDGIPASLLINSSIELAPILCKVLKYSFSERFIPPSFKRAGSGDRLKTRR